MKKNDFSNLLEVYMDVIHEKFDTSERVFLQEYLSNAILNIHTSIEEVNTAKTVTGRFGSTNSNDLDMFFVVDQEHNPAFLDAISGFFPWAIQEFEKRTDAKADNMPSFDFNFIVLERGNVIWSNKGNPQEINNAIYYTHDKHFTNYSLYDGKMLQTPVVYATKQDIAIKAIRCVTSLTTILSKTTHKDVMKDVRMRRYDNYVQGLDQIMEQFNDKGGLISSIDEEGFGKNQSDESLLKDITFGFIQLACMLKGEEVPYTKNAVFNTSYKNLLPLVFELVNFNNKYSCVLSELDDLIFQCIDECRKRVIMDNPDSKVIKFDGDEFAYNYVKGAQLQP